MNEKPMSMAALKRRLLVGTQYRLIDRQSSNAFGSLPADGKIRTVFATQTNGIWYLVEDQQARGWLGFGKGDTAVETPSGFKLIPARHPQGTATPIRLTYEWVTA